MLGQDQLAFLLLPVGELTKDEVRRTAAAAGLRTAAKPDSQDVCFISKTAGREGFLGERIPLGPGRLVTSGGQEVGRVEALELVTVGQRRGLGLGAPSSWPERRYVLDVDVGARTATVGPLQELLVERVEVGDMCWPAGPLPPGTAVLAQMSAHGPGFPGPLGGRQPCRRGGAALNQYDGWLPARPSFSTSRGAKAATQSSAVAQPAAQPAAGSAAQSSAGPPAEAALPDAPPSRCPLSRCPLSRCPLSRCPLSRCPLSRARCCALPAVALPAVALPDAGVSVALWRWLTTRLPSGPRSCAS